MAKPITTKASGICFAFPDVCLTPTPVGTIPIPYPNIGDLSQASGVSSKVKIGGKPIVLENSEIPSTQGDEAGSSGGVASGKIMGKVTFTTYSTTVKVEGKGVVRMSDTTQQNENNAVGTVFYGEVTTKGG